LGELARVADGRGPIDMLNAIPKAWFSWKFSLEEGDGTPVADLLLSSWRERGSVALRDGLRYTVRSRGIAGPLLLEAADGSEVAQATEPSAFRREFAVAHGERQYTLKAISWMRRECGVFAEGRQLGRVFPEIFCSRRAQVEIADELPLELQAFLVWLTLLLWKRQWDADMMPRGA
jgi:hypothetical protein